MTPLLTACRQIIKGYRDQPTLRLQVLGDFGRMLISNRFQAPGLPGRSRVAGLPFFYSKRASLYGMFHEIFVAQNYYIPATQAPLVIFDCGANVGMATRYFLSRAPNAQITAFEPNPHTVKILEQNVRPYGTRVTVHQVGLGEDNATMQLYTDTADAASQSASVTAHLKTKQYTVEPIAVQIKRLSEFLTAPIDILKMDIEGLEVAVIRELREAGALARVKRLFIEYHFDGVHAIDSLGQMLSDMELAGFHYVIHSSIQFPYMATDAPISKSISYKITAWQPSV